MESASLPKRFPRPAGNPSASDPGWGSAHPDSNSMPSPGRWGGHVPLMGGPWLGLQLMRQGYHLDMGYPLSASRVCGVSGESVQTFLSRHGAGFSGNSLQLFIILRRINTMANPTWFDYEFYTFTWPPSWPRCRRPIPKATGLPKR